MYRTTLTYHNKIKNGSNPIPYVIIQTHMGSRLYSERYLSQNFDEQGYFADGTYTADGSITAGVGLGLLEISSRVQNFGEIEKSLVPKDADVLTAYTIKQQQRLIITLDNSDLYFSKLVSKETFLTRSIKGYLGFADLNFGDHLLWFSGEIDQIQLSDTLLTITAYEAQ